MPTTPATPAETPTRIQPVVPDRTPFLTATALTAAGRQGPVFTDINLTAELGQIVALCGDGGEGRSSLLLALTGRFPFRSGELRVDGQTRPGQIRRRFTIAQAGPPIRFDPYATVATCIKETTTVSKGTATRANINAWLDRLAVDIDTGDTYGFLPRIDQIRLAIACAAASRTPAIAVDDTDTGLDTRGAERVFDALRTVADAGQLVLAVCTRPDPPADTVVDLRAQPAPAPDARRHGRGRNGDPQQ
ncbi:ATP-binding cassette domain-containing protein [Glycomyces sp. NPDC048151]|uniref:ATP-binding cassette domain-containing protein n=1 Tax=Glycomyces sp. NPDC048151 TaxID=3364002 RepID=UPI00370F9013